MQYELPFQKHSETSQAAAISIAPDANNLRAAVLRYIAGRGDDGATDEEVQDALEMNPSTQRPRRVELVRMGVVEDSGRRRKTKGGRQATVWICGG